MPKEYSPEYILSALHIESFEPSSSQYTKIGMLHNTVVDHYGLELTLKRFRDNEIWNIEYVVVDIPKCLFYP